MTALLQRPRLFPDLADAGHDAILSGVPFKSLEFFEQKSGLSPKSIQTIIPMTAKARAKRKEERRLTVFEAERLIRLARLFELATDLFDGDAGRAVRWLEAPCRALSGDTPISRAATEPGARDVEELIGRLEHGVYS